MSALQQRVMRRIYFIWALRKITSTRALKAYIVVGSVWQVFSSVSIVNVIHNATFTSDKFAILNFFARAFVNTELIVQGLLLATVVFGVWFLRDMFSTEKSMAVNMSNVGVGR